MMCNDQSKLNVEICYTEGVFGRGTFSASYFEQKYQENTHRNFRFGADFDVSTGTCSSPNAFVQTSSNCTMSYNNRFGSMIHNLEVRLFRISNGTTYGKT